jgi:tetratricopeptide (TPR) repeat protein
LKLMLCGWDRENADLAEHASALITGEQDLSMRLRRCSMEMVLEFLRANYPACCDATTRGKELARLVGDVYLFVLYESVEAFAQIYLGEWGRAQRNLVSALAISERNANPQAVALCHLAIGWLYSEAEEYGSASRRAEDALGPMIEANPFTFFVGRNLLARAYVRMGDLARARQHLDAMERRMEVDRVPMESLVIPHYLLTCCDYSIVIGDLDRAQSSASQFHEVTSAAPDRPFLALCYEAMARIAIRKQDAQLAGVHLAAAISILRHARLPHAAWRVYRTTAVLYESLGQAQRAAKWQDRSSQVIASLAETLDPGDPLRSASFFDADRDTGPRHEER